MAATGAAYGEKNPLRTAQRKRDWETRAAATPCKQKAPRKAPLNRLISERKLERVKRFERSTPTLARLCSTPELHPLARLLDRKPRLYG